MKRSRFWPNVFFSLLIGVLMTFVAAVLDYRTTDHTSCDVCGASVNDYGLPLAFHIDADGLPAEIKLAQFVGNVIFWSSPAFVVLSLVTRRKYGI